MEGPERTEEQVAHDVTQNRQIAERAIAYFEAQDQRTGHVNSLACRRLRVVGGGLWISYHDAHNAPWDAIIPLDLSVSSFKRRLSFGLRLAGFQRRWEDDEATGQHSGVSYREEHRGPLPGEIA